MDELFFKSSGWPVTLNGQEIQFKPIVCPRCKKMLLKVSGIGCIIEVPCPKCKVLVRWPIMAAEIVPRVQEGQRVKEPGFEK